MYFDIGRAAQCEKFFDTALLALVTCQLKPKRIQQPHLPCNAKCVRKIGINNLLGEIFCQGKVPTKGQLAPRSDYADWREQKKPTFSLKSSVSRLSGRAFKNSRVASQFHLPKEAAKYFKEWFSFKAWKKWPEGSNVSTFCWVSDKQMNCLDENIPQKWQDAPDNPIWHWSPRAWWFHCPGNYSYFKINQ